jgi:hypothetical protein
MFSLSFPGRCRVIFREMCYQQVKRAAPAWLRKQGQRAAPRAAHAFGPSGENQNEQKFFGSFFQKRTKASS